MSTATAPGIGPILRIWLGNAAVLVLLAVLAGALLPLHGEPWWVASPRPARWWWCAVVVLAYAGASVVFLRPRPAAQATSAASAEPPMLVAWASQTGFANALAERSAAALQAGGNNVIVLPLDQVDAQRLASTRRALFIASTTGEGDPPDHALRFLREVMPQASALPDLHYALLALGDREYLDFCAFGRQLDEWLRSRGAQPLFDRVDVDNADEAALRHWQYELIRIAGSTALADWSPPAYTPWRLASRTLLNAGSQGSPVHDLWLEPACGVLPPWQAGDIAEIGPRNRPAQVQALLARLGLEADAAIPGTDGETLAALLARSQLPDDPQALAGLTLDALVASLQPLPHREYSIASIPEEGGVRLLVRAMANADGSPGLGSGWLCQHAPVGGTIDLRVRTNPGFHPPPVDQPLVLVGNGTGMAGLRAHLRARVAAGARRNWLLFGERNADHDLFFGEELLRWQAQGWLQRLDLAFSRDGERRYVQDLLQDAGQDLRDWIDAGASVLVCGNASGMAPGVDAAIAGALGGQQRDALRIEGRYRRDVY